MNTLGYISRQYDALASQPTTPTTESIPLSSPFHDRLTRSQDDTDLLRPHKPSPKLHRTKSLSRTRSSEVIPDSVAWIANENDLNMAEPFPATTPPDNTTLASAPILSSTPPSRPKRKRFIVARLFISLWYGLCTLWSFLPAWKRVRHNFGLLVLQSPDDTSDEKEDDNEEVEDEADPLVTRAPTSLPEKPTVSRISFSTQVLRKRTSRSRFGKPPTPVVSPSDLAPLEYEMGYTSGVRTRTPSLSLTPPTPASAADVPLPESHTSTPPSEMATKTITRPRASSTLLPNPLSPSLLTPSSSTLPSRAPTPPIHRPTALHKAKTLVLDLDETLIHSTSRVMHAHGSMGGGGLLGLSGLFGGGKRQGAGHMVEVVLGGRSTLYHVYKRPFVDFFLRKVSSWYTLVIFTASMPEYADPVIDWLDAGRGMFAQRLFRESCTQLPSGAYSKDLSIIEQDLSRVCLIDNSPISYSINMANGIPIEGWMSDPGDEALLDLLPVLDSLRFTSDVRHVLGLRGF